MTDEAKRIVEVVRCAAVFCTHCDRRAVCASECSAYRDANKAADLIERLSAELEAAKSGGWISVEDRMPEEHDSVFAKYYGTSKWNNAMFMKESDRVVVAYRCADGAYIVRDGNTCDGRWRGVERDLDFFAHGRVTHWMPLPEPPNDGGLCAENGGTDNA